VGAQLALEVSQSELSSLFLLLPWIGGGFPTSFSSYLYRGSSSLLGDPFWSWENGFLPSFVLESGPSS
jgi:hypothetical protein